MNRPQFTTKDIALAVTLIAVGCAGAKLATRPDLPEWERWFAIPLVISCPLWIGAGLGAPFHRKLLGMLVGVLVAIATFIFFAVATYAMHRN